MAPAQSGTEPVVVNLASLGQPGTPGWEPFNGAAFDVAGESGRKIVHSRPEAGANDRGAFVSGIEFSEGTIEVDLRGANRPAGSFLGVVFHGKDGGRYDAVYFRPFNFGAPDPIRRSHAVQYMSHPEWPWNRLRNERPGTFEQPADPEPGAEDWFHARIEITDRRVRVFVGGAEKPCLDVEKVSRTKTGKVGLWFNGVAAFANLKIQSTK